MWTGLADKGAMTTLIIKLFGVMQIVSWEESMDESHILRVLDQRVYIPYIYLMADQARQALTEPCIPCCTRYQLPLNSLLKEQDPLKDILLSAMAWFYMHQLSCSHKNEWKLNLWSFETEWDDSRQARRRAQEMHASLQPPQATFGASGAWAQRRWQSHLLTLWFALKQKRVSLSATGDERDDAGVENSKAPLQGELSQGCFCEAGFTQSCLRPSDL